MEKILVTGATGYIGKRMISIIVSQGYKAICCCRDANRFKNVMELDDKNKIGQKAILRPKDLWARLYWIMVLPFHGFIFKGLIK